MKRIITLITCILTILNIDAQQQEYIRLTTDKECYLAGEDIWLKVCVSDKDNQPSDISKVAYIEISDPQQVYAQAKIDLTHGMGNGRIRLPRTMHSGAFQLTAYTRYMRNWGEKAFQRQIIAVVNTLQTAEDDRMEWTDSLPKSAAAPQNITSSESKQRSSPRFLPLTKKSISPSKKKPLRA